jgi:hypothetical protein
LARLNGAGGLGVKAEIVMPGIMPGIHVFQFQYFGK